MSLKSSQTKIAKVILLQTMLVFLLSVVFFMLRGIVAFWSLLCGGAVVVSTQVAFALMFFKHTGARQAPKIVNAFYLAECLKLVLTAIFFAVLFYSGKVEAMPLFVGFIVAQLGNWLALFVLEL